MNREAVVAAALLLWSVAGANAADDRLIAAVKRQDITATRALIAQGANVDDPQADGATALHWGAYLDDLPTVDALLRAGANVNAANELGVTPLMLACGNRSLAVVDRLLDAGADPNAGPALRETAVMTAARTGRADVMKRLLAYGGDANAKEATNGQTALMWAASERHADVVAVLVAQGADVRARTKLPAPRRRTERPSPGKEGAANEAGSRPGDVPVAKGAGVRTSDAPVANGAGGRSGDPSVASVLLTPPSDRSNGFTPLLFAARAGDVESARILLDAGADVNDAAADGMSALVLSTVRGHRDFATLLLERGADPNADGAGYTALHWASGTWESELTVRAITIEREGEWATVAGLNKGKLDFVQLLLARGADPNARLKKAPARAGSSKNPGLPELEGASPLLLAAMAGDAAVMRALVAAGADVRLATKAGGTVLMAAAGLGHVLGEDFVREADALAAAKLAFELGSDPHAVDAVGNTALHYAGHLRHDTIVQLLADHGVALDVQNKYGETALWASELVVQFSGGGTFQIVRSTAGDLLRALGAHALEPSYRRARPTEWPDVPRSAADEVADPDKPAVTPAVRR